MTNSILNADYVAEFGFPQITGANQNVDFTLVAPDLWFVSNIFDTESLNWMQGLMFDLNTVYEVTRPDRRLMMSDCNALQHIHHIGLSLIPTLNDVVNQKLNLMTSKYWLDLPQFGCPMHHDSQTIIVTLQVYIDMTWDPAIPGDLRPRGAQFMHVDPPVEAPTKVNGGYLNLNFDRKKHEVLPSMGSRCSVAFQYNLSTDS